MKRIEWFMNMLYYCNYMIRYKIRSSFDYLLLSIYDNACTRKFCKSDRYWKFVDGVKRAYNSMMWEKCKGFPVYNVLSGTYNATSLFVIIILQCNLSFCHYHPAYSAKHDRGDNVHTGILSDIL